MNRTSKETIVGEKEFNLYCVDSYSNGISFGHTRMKAGEDLRDHFALQLHERLDPANLRTRYAINKSNPLHELEINLMRLSRKGELSRSVLCLGTVTDPFFPFEGKFHASLKFLELFTKYRPGLLIVQTRSPLLVLAMPVLRKLGRSVSISMGIETHCEKFAGRYTPELPSVEDRVRAINTMRGFGIEVNIQVSPLLPYGDWQEDASHFAEFLDRHADHLYIKPLSGESAAKNRRDQEIAKRIALDRKFHWLRKDAATPLITEIENVAPQKLRLPHREVLADRQLGIFAA